MSKGGRELFTKNGKKRTDARIHERILAGGSNVSTDIGRQVATRCGLSAEQVKLIFPAKAETPAA